MERKLNLLFIVLSILLIGCNPEIANLKPKACFDYLPLNNIKTTDTIKFSNCSLNSSYYYWEFGDGSSSYAKEPKHVFKSKSSFKVKLFVANKPENDSINIIAFDTISKFVNIALTVPEACFSYSSLGGFQMSFSNCSINATNYLWDFGDGFTSTEKSPTHGYNAGGSYNVKLKASNEVKSDSIYKTISMNDIVSLNNITVPDGGYSLDVDGDGIVDFKIHTVNIGSITESLYSSIDLFNGYEIFSDSTTAIARSMPLNDTVNIVVYSSVKVCVPKIYIFEDMIQDSNKTENKNMRLCYYYSYFGYQSYYNNWIKDQIRYIGFRKLNGNVTKIGWIKLKVLDYAKMILYSYKIPTETDSLLIDK